MANRTAHFTPYSYKTKVSSSDTTGNFLYNKIVGSTYINTAIVNGGGNETLQISYSGPTATGTVTSVATDSTLIGGTITTSGTLGINLSNENTWLATQNFNPEYTVYTVGAPTSFSFSFVQNGVMGFFANGQYYEYIVYSYRTTPLGTVYETSGATYGASDPNDGDYYEQDLIWTAGTDASGYIVFDTQNTQYVDVGNVTSFVIDTTTSWTAGTPTLLPTSLTDYIKAIHVKSLTDWYSENIEVLDFGISGGYPLRFFWKNVATDSGYLQFDDSQGNIQTIRSNIDADTIILGGSSLTSIFVPQTRTLTINGTSYDLSADISWTISTGMTNPMTTLGDIIYGASSGTPTRLAGNTTTTQKFLGQVGTGSASAAPTWFDLFGTSNTWTAKQTIQLTTTQQSWNYNANNKTDITVDSIGSAYFSSQNNTATNSLLGFRVQNSQANEYLLMSKGSNNGIILAHTGSQSGSNIDFRRNNNRILVNNPEIANPIFSGSQFLNDPWLGGSSASSNDNAIHIARSGTGVSQTMYLYTQTYAVNGAQPILYLSANGYQFYTRSTTWTAYTSGTKTLEMASTGEWTMYAPTASSNVFTIKGTGTFTGLLQEWQYDSSNRFNVAVSSTGGVTFDAVGSGASFTFSDDVILANAKNIQTNTSTGTKFGTATSQKIGFWNATPIVQPTTAVGASILVSNGGTTLTDTDTFDGYTLKQVVKSLRNIGLLA